MRLIDADALDEEVMHLFIAITGNPKQSTVVNECKSSFRNMIEEQPTVGDWIPCSERLPNREEYLKDNGRFILDDGNRRYQGIFDIYDGKFKFAKHISGLHYELFDDNCVVAWQPLPEPYQPEGEKP